MVSLFSASHYVRITWLNVNRSYDIIWKHAICSTLQHPFSLNILGTHFYSLIRSICQWKMRLRFHTFEFCAPFIGVRRCAFFTCSPPPINFKLIIIIVHIRLLMRYNSIVIRWYLWVQVIIIFHLEFAGFSFFFGVAAPSISIFMMRWFS